MNATKETKERATIALSYFRAGRSGRALDACFEMGDGDAVVLELQKRARKNANTRALVNRYLAPQYHVAANETTEGRTL